MEHACQATINIARYVIISFVGAALNGSADGAAPLRFRGGGRVLADGASGAELGCRLRGPSFPDAMGVSVL